MEGYKTVSIATCKDLLQSDLRYNAPMTKVLILVLALNHMTPYDTEQLLKQLTDSSVDVRSKAFERLLAIHKSEPNKKFQQTLVRLLSNSLKGYKATRAAAIRELLKGRDEKMKSIDEMRKSAHAFLKVHDYSKMKPLVEEMWRIYFFDPAEVDKNEKVKESRELCLEYSKYAAEAGVDLSKSKLKSVEEIMDEVDEPALFTLFPSGDREPLNHNARQKKFLSPVEYKMVFIINQYRALMGSGALMIKPELCRCTREHSEDMKKHNFYAHESPLPGKKLPQDRLKLHGVKASAFGEIIASHANPIDAFWAWFHSVHGHHEKMIDTGYKQIGAGNFENLWTVMFIEG